MTVRPKNGGIPSKILKRPQWEFFETFTNCDITATATRVGEISTDKAKLTKYLQVSRINRDENHKIDVPLLYYNLLDLQSGDGKWCDSDAVRKCLKLPPDSLIIGANEWETATALAIAAIRQRIDLFNILGDAHDRGRSWLQSNDFINEASDILMFYKNEIPNTNETISVTKDCLTKSPTVARLSGFSDRIKHKFTVSGAEDAANLSTSEIEARMYKYYSNINMPELTESINILQLEIIELCAKVDKHLKAIKDCLHESLVHFKTAETNLERHTSLDRLNGMISSGCPPRPDFSDWRKVGVTGYRTLLIPLLNLLHQLAQRRLLLDETIEVQVHNNIRGPVIPKIDVNAGRWTMAWDGYDLVSWLLTSLDFMREYPELVGWYGQRYSLLANPLALPVSTQKLISDLDMTDYIRRHRETTIFSHKFPPTGDWRFSQYIKAWKQNFESAMACRHDWWPEAPTLSDMEQTESFFTAILVLGVKCPQIIERAATEEARHNSSLLTENAQKLKKKNALYLKLLEPTSVAAGPSSASLSHSSSTTRSLSTPLGGNLGSGVIHSKPGSPYVSRPSSRSDRTMDQRQRGGSGVSYNVIDELLEQGSSQNYAGYLPAVKAQSSKTRRVTSHPSGQPLTRRSTAKIA